MYIYGNNCNVNNECESGYSLYFPCLKSITRGEKVCFEFYIVDNSNKEEVDLREIEDISLNMFGRYNCNFGNFSYPENIKSLQYEEFSENIYSIDFSNIINEVKLYIDIVDEKHELIESFLYDGSFYLDVAIEGAVGYFINEYEDYNVLNLQGYDTNTYMFLGWNIDENEEECNSENIYDYLINSRKLTYNIDKDYTVRAVYQKRREYVIQMANDNYNSSFIVDYMGEKTFIREDEYINVLEGHDVKISCIPNDVMSYRFVRWEDGYENPYRIFNINGDNLTIQLKAYCSLRDINNEYIDNIDESKLNKFQKIYPEIRHNIFLDSYYIDNIYVNKCEIDILNNIPYIKIIGDGYLQILNINEEGNLMLLLDNVGGDCKLFINNYENLSSITEKNEFTFEFNKEIMTLTGNNSCIFGFSLYKEVIYDKGKCMLCLNSDDTLKLHTGHITVDGGVIVNDNPYGIPSVKIGSVTNITPLVVGKSL